MHKFVTRFDGDFPLIFQSFSESETEKLGAEWSKNLNAPTKIFLSGEVGAGKSVFARGFIRQLMRNQNLNVLSPTFPLVQIYETEALKIFHFDLYRLESEECTIELMFNLGFEEALNQIILMEWAEKLPSNLQKFDYKIEILNSSNEPQIRTIKIEKMGNIV